MYKSDFLDLTLLVTIYLINIVLYFITFSWIIMMEKGHCECSNNWKRTFIKVYIISMICFIFITCIFYLAQYMNYFTELTSKYENILNILKYFVLVAEIIFVAIVFIYIRDLIKNKCSCSESLNRDITLVYSTVDGVIMILSLVLIIIIGIYQIIS